MAQVKRDQNTTYLSSFTSLQSSLENKVPKTNMTLARYCPRLIKSLFVENYKVGTQ